MIQNYLSLIRISSSLMLVATCPLSSISILGEELNQNGQAQLVSLQELQHKSPRKALREFKIARAAFERQQFGQAADHFKRALAVDPAFADAHNDLGVVYMRLEDYRHSTEHLQKAIDLAPTHQPATENLCLVLLHMGRFAEAGQAADRILRRGGGSSIAHYAAAAGLLFDGGSRREALFHLRRVDGQIPNARLLIARILADTGHGADAARELEGYLSSQSGDPRRPRLEAWLAELRQ